MTTKVTILYRGCLAHYLLSRPWDDLVQADLVRYDGKSGHAPPAQLILTRKEREWISNIDREPLVKELGKWAERKFGIGIQQANP